jgi:hypothetical protein
LAAGSIPAEGTASSGVASVNVAEGDAQR